MIDFVAVALIIGSTLGMLNYLFYTKRKMSLIFNIGIGVISAAIFYAIGLFFITMGAVMLPILGTSLTFFLFDVFRLDGPFAGEHPNEHSILPEGE